MTWELTVLILGVLTLALLATKVFLETEIVEEDVQDFAGAIAALSSRIHKLEKEVEEAKKFISQQNLAQGLRGIRS